MPDAPRPSVGPRCAAVAVLGLLLAACSGAEVKSGPPQGNWTLSNLGGSARAGATLAFMDGDRVAGRGGCNRYASSIQAGAAGALAFAPVVATKMACPEGDAMQLEADFFAMLAATRGFRHEPGRRLQLLGADGAVLAEFRPGDPDPS